MRKPRITNAHIVGIIIGALAGLIGAALALWSLRGQ